MQFRLFPPALHVTNLNIVAPNLIYYSLHILITLLFKKIFLPIKATPSGLCTPYILPRHGSAIRKHFSFHQLTIQNICLTISFTRAKIKSQ